MALSNRDRRTLRDVGFTSDEIQTYARAVTPSGNPQSIDITTGTWQKAMIIRETIIRGLRKAEGDLDQDELDDIFDDYYSVNRARNPWDWVKIAYKPPKKTADFLVAYRNAMERTKGLRKRASYFR